MIRSKISQHSAPLNHNEAEICHILPDVSSTTVEAVLGAMVKDGTIKQIGSGRASRYLKT